MTLRVEKQERILREEARRQGWTRWSTPARYIIFILMVVGLVTMTWFYFEEKDDAVDPRDLRTVHSEAEPYKVKLEDQDIPHVRHQDKLVYGRLDKDADQEYVEHLLPEPEAPVALHEPEAPVQMVRVTEESAPEVIKPAVVEEPVPVAEPQLAPRKAKDAIGDLISKEGLDQSHESYVQLGTLESEALAKKEWKRLAKVHKKDLGSRNPLIAPVEIEGKGSQYSLRVGPFASDSHAASVCKSLKAEKVSCFVVH